MPFQLVKKHVEVKFTANTVEVMYGGRRVAMYPRSTHRGKFTTLNEHRPKAHQRYLEWTPSRLVDWAQKTGPATAQLVERIMSSRPHPMQGFRSCIGIMGLAKKYSPERLEQAAVRALKIQSYSYRSIKSILASGIDLNPYVKVMETVIVRGK